MKLYKTAENILIEKNNQLFAVQNENWDEFVNDEHLFEKLNTITGNQKARSTFDLSTALAPIGNQEVWACGVTYLRSKIGRQEESKDAGGGDFYAKVYEADRPEVFFKSTAHRVVGPNQKVRIRKDSKWDVPEPELTLLACSSGKIIGYTIGNDMSSRSIEGENPLYLPQAKTYDGAAAIGPCIYVTNQPLPLTTTIQLNIGRNNKNVFSGKIEISQIKRKLEELVSFVFRECSFPHGCFIMTGTGIVPENNFTLHSGDEIKIDIDGIGQLVNIVE
ncbi:MAG: fumarylacetoacetate hydrolase family protein [Chitinophagaceae bacterium]